MQSVPREWLDFLRQQFPKDSRIQLTEIGGNPRPISPGSTGKLDYIDDAGQFHVKWDNGCTLALVLGEDRFSVYLPEPQTFKLYMPLTADFYGRDEWGDMSEDGEEWDGHTLMDYEGQILSALVKNRVPEENESGLMRWYGEDDSVDHKVRSAVFTVEVRNRQLWGVAECRVAGELTPEELTILKEYLGGQASDGWGEGFEQRPIEVDGGELYVHLWQPDDWSIQTEQERFAPKVAEGLPELCFSTLRTTGQLICIKRGETGYYPSDWDTGDKEGNVELADELNEDLGVTPIQRQAIVLLETMKAADKDHRVFKLQFEAGEFDMVIYDQKENSCEIFEIKHSSKQVPFQYRHLVDEDKCQRTERRFGPIHGRYILYRGEDAQMENGVQYWNVENYLKALPTLDIVQVQEIGMQSIEPTL